MPPQKIRRRKQSRDSAVCLAILVVFVGAQGSWAQADKSFFEGKTMQLLVASGPGATTDISARLVGRYLGKHIPGNPNIIVQNMPGAGGVVAANHLYRRRQIRWSHDRGHKPRQLHRANGRPARR